MHREPSLLLTFRIHGERISLSHLELRHTEIGGLHVAYRTNGRPPRYDGNSDGTFKWTKLVGGLCILLLRYKEGDLLNLYPDHPQCSISGDSDSPSHKLSHGTKNPTEWAYNILGRHRSGKPFVWDLIHFVNPQGKDHDAPTVARIVSERLKQTHIEIATESDGLVRDHTRLRTMWIAIAHDQFPKWPIDKEPSRTTDPFSDYSDLLAPFVSFRDPPEPRKRRENIDPEVAAKQSLVDSHEQYLLARHDHAYHRNIEAADHFRRMERHSDELAALLYALANCRPIGMTFWIRKTVDRIVVLLESLSRSLSMAELGSCCLEISAITFDYGDLAQTAIFLTLASTLLSEHERRNESARLDRDCMLYQGLICRRLALLKGLEDEIAAHSLLAESKQRIRNARSHHDLGNAHHTELLLEVHTGDLDAALDFYNSNSETIAKGSKWTQVSAKKVCEKPRCSRLIGHGTDALSIGPHG